MSIQETFTDGSPQPQEPIPGYRLLERLGRGGYGEVWKTLAPGGVPKAIKLVYADDPARMATELRALNRIKDVRHPFLLSIERIEHRGELLAIVTELGDANLQQHYQSCLNKGLPGIPQNDLLGMMRDVADVLDYIYQEHALQHLDIKPANLLQFGKRLKVADFGLVKNIYERSESLVHGLTPTYAAPEIFEGKPTRASDQYSLAVLYQEMLTGVLPFNGATAARLATQHLREAPDLRPLPATQQPVIARALSKDPNQRFSSCMELVQELTVAASRTLASAPAATANEPPLLRDVLAKRPSEPVSTSRKSVLTQSAANGDTAPPYRPVPEQESVPTILIGVGGAAGKALQGLRMRIADRLGGVDKLTAFKMLFLDIDNDTLNEINRDHQAWSELETIITPLHNPSEYREQGQLHRRWLSRRWLFNVPRNLRTEGLRPLGRLALMTNANRVLASLRSAILHVTSSFPGKCPRVLFVSSISGGTGSGMIPDLAYAARHELRNAGFPEAPVEGLLLHSTPVGTGRDKAVLNAIATLREIEHYSAPGSFYPGEPLLQIPPFHGNNQTFTSTQFFHLGEGVDGPTWLRGIDNVAELLYCRLLTNLDPALNAFQAQTSSESPSVDLVQMEQIGGYSGSFADDLARQLCVDVIESWCGAGSQVAFADPRTTSAATVLLNSMEHRQNAKTRQLTAEAEQKVLNSGVDIEQLLNGAREMLRQQLTVSQQDFLQAQFNTALLAVNDDVPNHEVARLVIALQDQSIGLDFGERRPDTPHNTLFDLLNSRLTSQAMPIASRYIAWVCELIDQPASGIDAARHAAEAGRDCIRDLIGVLGKDIRERQTRQTNSRIRLTSPPTVDETAKNRNSWLSRRTNPRVGLAERLIEHGLCSFEELVDVLVHWQLRTIEAGFSAVVDQLLGMCQELKQLGKRIGSEGTGRDVDKAQPITYENALQRWLVEHRLRLVQELRARIDQHILTGPRKLQSLLMKRGSFEQVIGTPLQHHARQVVLRSMDQLLCTVLQLKSQGLGNQELVIDGALLNILRTPWMIEGNDNEQAVLMAPAATGESSFYAPSAPELPRLPIVPAKINNVAICRRRNQVPLDDVIQAITHGQTALLSIAANLHTRIDVEWQSHIDRPAPAVDSAPVQSEWSEVQHTVSLTSMS